LETTIIDSRFEVLNPSFSRGGWSDIWLVRDLARDGERAVLKLLRIDLNASPLVTRCAIRERMIMTQIDHPDIESFVAHGLYQDKPYTVYRYENGCTLDSLLTSRRRTNESLRFAVGPFIRTLLSAISHLHDRHIIHRDISTSNILVKPGGVPVLIDFSMVMSLEEVDWYMDWVAMGCPDFMPLESWEGFPYTKRTDVFSLGVILFLLFENRFPFPQRAFLSSSVNLDRRYPPRSMGCAPPGVDPIILQCLSPDPLERCADAGELLQALEPFLHLF